jgi:hypothetical protein
MSCLAIIPTSSPVPIKMSVRPPGRCKTPPLIVDAKEPSMELGTISYDRLWDRPMALERRLECSRCTQTSQLVKLEEAEVLDEVRAANSLPRRRLNPVTSARPSRSMFKNESSPLRQPRPPSPTPLPRYIKYEGRRKGGRYSGKSSFWRFLTDFFQYIFGFGRSGHCSNGRRDPLHSGKSVFVQKNESFKRDYVNDMLKMRKLEIENAQYRKLLRKDIRRQMSSPLSF